MTGDKFFEDLPAFVHEDIEKTYNHLSKQLGPVGFEWVHDGSDVWVVQLHHGAVSSSDSILFPGEPNTWIKFNINEGLEALRKKISKMRHGQGLILDKNVGLTSHIAELIRNAEIPARVSQR